MDINFQHCLHVCDPPHPCPITSMEDKVKAECDSLQEKGAGCGDSHLLCAHRAEGLALGTGDRLGRKDGPVPPRPGSPQRMENSAAAAPATAAEGTEYSHPSPRPTEKQPENGMLTTKQVFSH